MKLVCRFCDKEWKGFLHHILFCNCYAHINPRIWWGILRNVV